MAKQQFDAVVIGGGHNGLTCAYYLAKGGLRVLVLEAHHEVGGAAFTEEFHPGFRNSVAAYTVSLLQPKVIEDMQLSKHGLRVVLRKVDNFLSYEDGYLLSGRDGLTLREIARHNPQDAKAYHDYSARLSGIVAMLRQWLLRAPPNLGGGLADLWAALKLGKDLKGMGRSGQRDLLDFFMKSSAEILERYFQTPIVQALFGFDSIVGHFASPYQAGTAYVLLHHVFGEAAGVSGAWGHAMGGMGSITQAMKRAALAAGVSIETSAKVTEVIVNQQGVAGVVANGNHYQTKIVASAIHPQTLYQKLIDQAYLDKDFRWRIGGYKSHSGTFRMNIALSGLPSFTHQPSNPDFLSGGMVFAPSLNYMDRAYNSAKETGWSNAPIVEMLIPSTLDDSLAPTGQHVASLFCQHFSYHLPDGASWDDKRETAADDIIKLVESHAPGFSKLIIGRQIHSPLDLERRFGLVGGDIFHGAMGLDQLFSARPILGYAHYQGPISGLYMAGSGTHPGGGVTGAPGHNAAHAILKSRRYLPS